ncbi:MAG: hypothetical protein HPY64_08695 [Anaerolineae bacterium]|nr:hypothetical protein [Anaerolineae bacterium]
MRERHCAMDWLCLGSQLLAVVACFLPWLWHPAAALSPQVFDLAEWTSLVPEIRNRPVALLPSLLLRSSVALLAVAIWLAAVGRQDHHQVTCIQGAIAVCLTLMLLPPADFFLTAQEDPNYRQQFWIALVAVGIMVAAIVSRPRLAAWIPRLAAVALFLGAACAIAGLIASAPLTTTLGVSMRLGAGIFLYVLGALASGACLIRLSLRQETVT